MATVADSVKLKGAMRPFDSSLTIFGELFRVNGESLMAGQDIVGDSLNIVRSRIGARIAEIEDRVARLKPVSTRSPAPLYAITLLDNGGSPVAARTTRPVMLPVACAATRWLCAIVIQKADKRSSGTPKMSHSVSR